MFILLRRIERWLHQHVFKVGWLSTHDYQTTTILYYTFFMPGVILHEVVYYLAAGIMNVRAERQIAWPDKQEVAELKLNFVKLAPRTSAFRKAVITSAPLLVGLVCIWLISNNIFDITAVVERMRSGELVDIIAAIDLLLGAPLFWLWVYIIFTVANTMFPTTPKDLRGWRSVLIGLGVVSLATLLIGIGGEIFEALQAPLSLIINVLIQTFVLLILVDLLMVVVLGLIEYMIERITGHSATFRGNKMITMTRQELLEEREKVREREQKRREREQRRREADTGGPTTIYALAFEIPGAPGDEPVTRLEPLDEPDVPEAEPEPEESARPASMPLFGGLADDSASTSSAPVTEEERQQREAIAARINLPSRKPTPPPPEVADDDKIEEVVRTPVARQAPIAPKIVPDDVDNDEEVIKDTEADEQDSIVSAPDKPKTLSLFGDGNDADDDEVLDTEDDDEDDIEQPAASVASRFGAPSRFGRTTSEPELDDDSEGDDDEAVEDRPVTATPSRFGSRFGKPDDESDTEDKPTISTPSRFGSRFGKPDDDSDTEDKATASSRFGVKPFAPKSDEDDEPEEVIRVVGRPASPSLLDDADDEDDESLDENIARRERGRDAISSMFDGINVGNDEDEDDESIDEARRQQGRDAIASMFDGINVGNEDEDEESLSTAARLRPSGGNRFGSRFGGLTSPTADEDDDSDDESVSSGFLTGRPMGGSPFSRTSPLSPTPSTEDDDEDETIQPRPTRFGSGLTSPRASSSDDDSTSSRFGQRRSTPSQFGSRFGSSRPAPKPSFGVDDDDEERDDLDDEIVYEDIEDEYEYEDVEEYADYDDDDDIYYDDDD